MALTKIIACVHLQPLPGSPGYAFNNRAIIERAVDEVDVFAEAGINGIIIENTSDVPYLKGKIYPETISLLSIICHEIRKRFGGYLGLQVLAGANIEAMSIAYNAGLDFIRVEGYAFAHIADEGLIQSSAAELMRKRAQLRAESVKVIADIKKKHGSHAITSDLSLSETARLTEFMEPDGIVITGFTTGEPPALEKVRAVRQAVSLPLYVGSGVTAENAVQFCSVADYLIVGSCLKKGGNWKNELDRESIERFMQSIDSQA